MAACWQTILKEAVWDPKELCELLELELEGLFPDITHLKTFPLRVPRGFIARMEKKNSQDPLLLQVLPQKKEFIHYPGFQADPLQETRSSTNPLPGLLHKYARRVLLILSAGCAVHCRYCFRREFPYTMNQLNNAGMKQILEYILKDESIREVILSGGDPLLLKDEMLQKWVKELSKVPHLEWLRIHTRLPIVIPERITSALIALLKSTRLKPIVVLHCNHPREIDQTLIEALSLLRKENIVLFNQAVLLKGINNNLSDLVALSERLFENGVLPYYLHLLDRVLGVAHFEVNEEEANVLMKGMLSMLPGYLVPKLVREVPNAVAKLPIPIHL